MEMEREVRRKKIKSREMDRMALITGWVQNLDTAISKSSSFSDIRTEDLPKHSRSSSEPGPSHLLLDRAHGASAPPNFIVNTACYLINRGSHTGIDCKTTYEVWSDTPADYSLLRVFGSTIYYHVSEGKLEPRAKKGVFVDYGEGVKGYRIWSPSENKVIHSRNVVFDENSMLNSVVKFVGAEESGSIDKQVELQVTHNESESQLQGGEDQHTTAETTGSDIHSEARQRSIAIDRARRTGVKPPQKYGFEDMLAYAL
ncbi:hypothetical protein SASPL_115798 [Salvia splendens]|uniref:Retroviral polymerase SH3-like domain-containing protein n=1 Tax=Salvia splendens TaxID=180675 RepID=A0A8X9A1Y8_SALSN|nr:hypothetical protein SASPL_115798 [Salvia splendens]